MKTVIFLRDCEVYPDGDRAEVFYAGAKLECSDTYAELLISKGLAALEGESRPVAPPASAIDMAEQAAITGADAPPIWHVGDATGEIRTAIEGFADGVTREVKL